MEFETGKVHYFTLHIDDLGEGPGSLGELAQDRQRKLIQHLPVLTMQICTRLIPTQVLLSAQRAMTGTKFTSTLVLTQALELVKQLKR